MTSQMCAWAKGTDACQGDSGGPLTVAENGESPFHIQKYLIFQISFHIQNEKKLNCLKHVTYQKGSNVLKHFRKVRAPWRDELR